MEIGAIYKESVQRLVGLYGAAEATSMVAILFEDLLGISKQELIRKPKAKLEIGHIERLEDAIGKLLSHIPIQHIVGFTYFLNRKFFVGQEVLIPRPETEELVMLICKENKLPSPSILDIGTGSGCIPISLALNIPQSKVYAVDISAEALRLAEKNAQNLKAKVTFRKLDILEEVWTEPLDILVSNPPYIPLLERASISKNVVDHEPAIALFVPDEDPLIFYRRIGETGIKILRPEGRLYVEIHEKLAKKTAALFTQQGYRGVTIHQDLNGKERMVSAIR